MDAIIKSWRLCTFAGFIGFIVLFLCLNHGQPNHNLSTLGDVAIPSSSSPPPSPSDHHEPRKNIVIESEDIETIGEEILGGKCNIFDGKWVYEPKKSPLYKAAQCPFLSDQVSCQRNGRPDSEYEGWTWEFQACHINPRYSGRNMLEKLRGKRVIIVGDSLNRNQWESLSCLLYSSLPSSPPPLVDVILSSVFKVFTSKEYNCSVEFHWSPFLVQLEELKQPINGSRRILRLDQISSFAHKWKGADIMLFNTGHWWAHRGTMKAWDSFQYEGKLMDDMKIESAFKIAFGTWARWIDDNVKNSGTTVFFRSISPEHKGKQWCYDKTQPMLNESYVHTFPNTMIEIIENTIGNMKTPVRYLNITNLSQFRIDAHPSIYRNRIKLREKNQLKPEPQPDCSHWCLPGLPDTWNKLMYASMVLDTSSDSSTVSH